MRLRHVHYGLFEHRPTSHNMNQLTSGRWTDCTQTFLPFVCRLIKRHHRVTLVWSIVVFHVYAKIYVFAFPSMNERSQLAMYMKNSFLVRYATDASLYGRWMIKNEVSKWQMLQSCRWWWIKARSWRKKFMEINVCDENESLVIPTLNFSKNALNQPQTLVHHKLTTTC